MDTASNDTHAYFGIGCYTFEAPDADLLTMENPKGTYSIHSWARDVEAALRSIPSLDNILVSGFHSVRGDHAFNWRETTRAALQALPHSALHPGGDFRPHPIDGHIGFDVTIPLHIQSEVFPLGHNRTGTRFRVDISYAHGMPVAFVRSFADGQDPSLSVAIVREFLNREFDKHLPVGNPIKFVCMGPSPAWIDFTLNTPEVNEVSESDRVTIADSPGYKSISLRITKQPGVTTLEEFYSFIQAVIAEPASVYYDLVSDGNIGSLTRQYIESQLQELVDLHRDSRAKSFLKRIYNGGRAANDLMLEILAVDLEEKRATETSEERWAEIRSPSAKRIIQPLFSREIRRSGPDWVSNARAVVDLLSARQSRSVELLGVIISAIVGGVVGASLTALLH